MARILVVEDDPALRKIYLAILTREGHEVTGAFDGAEGLRLATANEPDLILLDMMMPKMNGIEFLRAYDIKGQQRKVKVVAFSNTEQQDFQDQARALGAVRYTTKFSFTPKSVVGMIKEVLAAP